MARPFEFFAVFVEQLSGFLSGRPKPRPEDSEPARWCSRPGCRRGAALSHRGRYFCRLHRPPLASLVDPPQETPTPPDGE